MQLTRRDALAALASAGILAGGGAAAYARDQREGDEVGDVDDATGDADDVTAHADSASGVPGGATGEPPTDVSDEAILDALVGTAEVVYPSAVENVAEFVRTYGRGKLDARPAYRRGAGETLQGVDVQAELSFESSFDDLGVVEREAVLRRLGADSAESDPNGAAPHRVRYYFVNETLFALYSSPTGGDLVGIENPQGHPGGTESYQRGPNGPGSHQREEG